MVSERLRGRHGLHNLLDDAYGVEIPERDFGPVVLLIDEYGATQRTIAELMYRFTPHLRWQCGHRVVGVLAGNDVVPPSELERVEQLLAMYGYRELPGPFEQPSLPLADGEHRGLGTMDGPDRLHRIHNMLAGAYPIEIPESDYGAVILLLRRLRLSVLGIVEVVTRFAPDTKYVKREEVEAILVDRSRVASADLARVEKILTTHGLAELARVENPPWVRTKEEPDPEDPRVPAELKAYWRAIARARPEGARYNDDVSLAIILRDAGLTDAQIKLLVSTFTGRPEELVQVDLDHIGTSYMQRSYVDEAFRKALGFERA